MKLSIIIPVLNSYEIVRRHLLHFKEMNLPDSVEIIFVDDGSDPPIQDTVGVKNLRIIRTNDKRPWTWALARNRGAKEARGEYFLMTDLDYIIPKDAIDKAAPDPASVMAFTLPILATSNANLNTSTAILATSRGACVASKVAF